MNAFVKKEIRLLLPSLVLGLLATMTPGIVLMISGPISDLSAFFLIPIFVTLLSVKTFGGELSAETFSGFLSLPLSREKMWWVKTALSFTGILLIALLTCFTVKNEFKGIPLGFGKIFILATLFLLTFYSGGLWTTLLLRHVGGAFWFSLLLPIGLIALLKVFVEPRGESIAELWLMIAFGFYALAGFFFARRLFLRAQDVQWTGGDVRLPGFRKARASAGVRQKGFRPLAALMGKETQLHQSQLIMAGALLILHLVVLALRKWSGAWATQPTTAFILQNFWGLWFLIPLLIGSAAVAEERKLGTLENQLCLPVRGCTQFLIKFALAMVFAIVLALAAPLLLEGKILAGTFTVNNEMPPHPTLILFIVASGTAAISFYFSSLFRNTLQSLGPAAFGCFISALILAGSFEIHKMFPFPVWNGWLFCIITVPIMGITFIGLGYSNFRSVVTDWRREFKNLVVALVALICSAAITVAVYHRVWEFAMPRESAHGAARLDLRGAALEMRGDVITVRLADGRAWLGVFQSWDSRNPTRLAHGGGRFLEKTNWQNLTPTFSGVAGIQRNGSLWTTKDYASAVDSPSIDFVRVGDDFDWKECGVMYRALFLLKTNGTLWKLDQSTSDKSPRKNLQIPTPKSLGPMIWKDLTQMGYRPVLRDEQDRGWGFYQRFEINKVLQLDEETRIYRAVEADNMKAVTEIYGMDDSATWRTLGVRDDGAFLITGNVERKNNVGFEMVPKNIQLSEKTNWSSVTAEAITALAINANGELWKWKFPRKSPTHPPFAFASRLSKHSDWIALSRNREYTLLLAGDGTLWAWPFSRLDSWFLHNSEKSARLLIPSRKPQKIGNIFDAPRLQ